MDKNVIKIIIFLTDHADLESVELFFLTDPV